MWLFRHAWQHLRWSWVIYKKFFKLVPWRTVAVVFFTLVSQFTMLFASLLPLKVIILIGSTKTPGYFPGFLAAWPRDTLIVSLSVIAFACYIAHLIAEKVIEANAERGAVTVLQRSRKLTLFLNQERIAKRAYQRFAKGLAAFLFADLALLVFAVIYPDFLLVLIGYLVVVAIALSVYASSSATFRHWLGESSGNAVMLFSGIGFLLLFSFMVFDYLAGSGTSVVAAIVCLLLSRQLFQRLSGAINDAVALHGQKLQINSMFFHGHVLLANEESAESSQFWALLDSLDDPRPFEALLAQAWQEHRPETLEIADIRWRQTGIIDVLAFDVTLRGEGPNNIQHVLIKVFNHKQHKLAMSESEVLLADQRHALPAPRLIGVGQLAGYNAHVFENPPGRALSSRDLRRQEANTYMACWKASPTQNLVDRYRRSHPLLHQRLTQRLPERLRSIAEEEQRPMVEAFEARFEEIVGVLSELPLCVINRDISNESVRLLESGGLILTEWGRWMLEPVGAAFPLNDKALELIPSMLERAAPTHPALGAVSAPAVRLTAYLYALERLYNKQKFRDALDQLPGVLQALQDHQAATQRGPAG